MRHTSGAISIICIIWLVLTACSPSTVLQSSTPVPQAAAAEAVNDAPVTADNGKVPNADPTETPAGVTQPQLPLSSIGAKVTPVLAKSALPVTGYSSQIPTAFPSSELVSPQGKTDAPGLEPRLANAHPGSEKLLTYWQSESYKTFIKLQVSLATGSKNALGIQSYSEAYAHYCQQARDLQDPVAEFAMGWMYSTGRGVAVNHDIAARFFSLSAIQGHRDAREWLDREPGNPALAALPDCMKRPSQQSLDWLPADVLFKKRGSIFQLVKKHAPVYGVDIDLAMAVIAVESGFNPKATSRKNAQGLMQLMPETQARFHVKDAYDPEDNIRGGLSYLRWLLAFFKGDVELVAAAYNAGEQAVSRYQGVPPYPETRDYVKRIAHFYKKKFHAYGHH